VADTTDLLNRSLFSVLLDVPFLWTVWAGPSIAQSIIKHRTWRWGYGIWAIVLPCAFLPLATVLLINQLKAKRKGQLPPSQFSGHSPWQVAKKLYFRLDVFGLCLLVAAVSLILVPLTLAANAKGVWRNNSIIGMLCTGLALLAVFPFWERNKKLAPHAFFPKELFANRTIIAGVVLGFFYFSKLHSEWPR
jgi:hypothetical protein